MERWWLNPTLNLRWRGDDLMATTGDGSEGLLIPPLMVGLLDCFKQPAGEDEGVRTFLSRYADDEDDPAVVAELTSFVATMREGGILVSEQLQAAAGALPELFAKPGTHVWMLSDHTRTAMYREALARHVRDKVAVEIGCGSGVLACFAARAGAKRVYAIEETAMVEVAREIVARNGLDDRVVFVPGSSAKSDLPEQADVVYSEIIGIDPLGEGVLPTLRDAAERFLAPGGTMIPRSLSLHAVCLHSANLYKERYFGQHAARRAERLGATYGLDLTPLVDAYLADLERRDAEYRSNERVADPLLAEHWDESNEILSDEALVAEFDLTDPDLARAAERRLGAELSVNRSLDPVLQVPLVFEATRPGIHNAVAVYFEIDLDDELTLTNSPFSVQMAINWGGQLVLPVEDARVAPGDAISLQALVDPSAASTVSFRRR